MPSLPFVQKKGCSCPLSSWLQAALSDSLMESTRFMTNSLGLSPHHSGICRWRVACGILHCTFRVFHAVHSL